MYEELGENQVLIMCACLFLLAQVPDSQPVVVVISGPSGVGKDAVVQRLKELRSDLYFVVTATSRCVFSFCSQRVWPISQCNLVGKAARMSMRKRCKCMPMSQAYAPQ